MKVSIIINNYNYGRFLAQSIETALNQTHRDLEVIVVDDGSTDDSQNVIAQFNQRILSVSKTNAGQASAINAGFQASTGNLVCFLDADDYFFSEKVEKVLKHFQKHPKSGWCFHELQDVDISGHPLLPGSRHEITDLEYVSLKDTLLKGKKFSHWFPATSGLCFRREVLNEILPMPDAFTVSADSFIRLAAIYLSPGVLIPEKLATHRQHGKNIYEFRPNTHVERMKLGIKTAYYLRSRFPRTSPFTNKHITFCLGKLTEYTNLFLALGVPETKRYLSKEKSISFRVRFYLYLFKGQIKKLLLSR